MASAYSQALISYIDLLGFKDLIDEGGDNADKVQSILKIAREEFLIRRATDTQILSGKKSFQFSDLIVRCTTTPEQPYQPEALVIYEVAQLSEKQLKLLLNHMLIRGGISCGKIFTEDDYLFGQGLIKSYILESEYAIFPRIVIDRDLVDISSSEDDSRGINSNDPAIDRGQDGVYYINYLYGAVMERLNSGSTEEALRVLDQHRRAVEFMLKQRIHVQNNPEKRKPTERMKQKYMWLGLYHNAVIRRLRDNGEIPSKHAVEISAQLLRF
jgi:hypothetical protein